MNADKKRNGKIELLRFVFAVVVVIFHGFNVMTDKEARIMFSGRMSGEFFFLVSGFLMAASAQKVLSRGGPVNAGRETEKFLFRKYKSLYPTVIVGNTLCLLGTAYFKSYSFTQLVKSFINSIPCMFLFHYTGIHITRINVTWFLSVMLISMAVLYPLLLRHHSVMRRIGSLLGGSMILGYLMITTKDLTSPDVLLGNLIYKGTLRGFADIALGIFAYEMSGELQRIRFTDTGKKLLAAAELLLYGVVFYYMLLCQASRYDYFILYIMLAAITISFSGVSWGSEWFNNRFCYRLGASSLYIYLSHSAVGWDLTRLVGPDCGNKGRMVVYLLLAAVCTAIVWSVTSLIRKLLPHVKKLLVSQEA